MANIYMSQANAKRFATKVKSMVPSAAGMFLAAHPVGSLYEGPSPSGYGGTWQLMPNCGRTGWVWKRTE